MVGGEGKAQVSGLVVVAAAMLGSFSMPWFLPAMILMLVTAAYAVVWGLMGFAVREL